MSGFGSGCRSGWACSIRASTQEPSSANAANIRNWPQVRAVSPRIRASGSPVSRGPRSAISSPAASIASAIARRNFPRASPESAAKPGSARRASSTARSTSSKVAERYSGGNFSPLAGFTARPQESEPCPRELPIIDLP
jgi:hypothetical protein